MRGGKLLQILGPATHPRVGNACLQQLQQAATVRMLRDQLP